MERYAINRMTEATELLYSRNGMTATQKYEAIQAIFTQLTDHAKTGSRRGLRSFGEVMEDWVSDLEKRFDPSTQITEYRYRSPQKSPDVVNSG